MASRHPNDKLEALHGLKFYKNKTNWKLRSERTDTNTSLDREKRNETYNVPSTSSFHSPRGERPTGVMASPPYMPYPHPPYDAYSMSAATAQMYIPETYQASMPCPWAPYSTQNRGMLPFGSWTHPSQSRFQQPQDVNWTIMDNEIMELTHSITSSTPTMAPPYCPEMLQQVMFKSPESTRVPFRTPQYPNTISWQTSAGSSQSCFPYTWQHNEQDVQNQTQYYGFTRNLTPQRLPNNLYPNGYGHQIYPEQSLSDNAIPPVVPSRDFDFPNNATKNVVIQQEVNPELRIDQGIPTGRQNKTCIWINPALVAIGQDPRDDETMQQGQELWESCEQEGLSESSAFMEGAHCAAHSTLKDSDDSNETDMEYMKEEMTSTLNCLPGSSGLQFEASLRNLVEEEQREEKQRPDGREVNGMECPTRDTEPYDTDTVLDGSHTSHDTTQLNSGVIKIIMGRPYRL